MPHQPTPVHTAAPEKQVFDPKTRQTLLRLLAGVPGVVEAVRTASTGQVFRAVMSEKNAHLFKQATDGYYKPFLRESGRFAENVNLEAISPDYSKCFADLSLSITLAAIVAKLDNIRAAIEMVGKVMADANRGEVLGALDALASAGALTDPTERRHHLLGRCLDVEMALGKLAGQLKSHAQAMPSPETSWLSVLFDDGLAKASAAYAEVEQDMMVFTKGLRELTQSFQELDEPEMARTWMRRIALRLEEAALPDAVAKARLVPMGADGFAAEKRLAMLLPLITDLNSQASGSPVPSMTIEFDLKDLLA